MDRATWIAEFARALNDLAAGHEEKANFARHFGRDIAEVYLDDAGVWKNPREAAKFEFDCWRWWGRVGPLGLPERA